MTNENMHPRPSNHVDLIRSTSVMFLIMQDGGKGGLFGLKQDKGPRLQFWEKIQFERLLNVYVGTHSITHTVSTWIKIE